MNILDNPFYILDVSLSDNRRTIMSTVQDASLLGDPEKCNKAGSLLTNHKNRVKCEVFYLPELCKTEIKTRIEQLQSDPNNLLITILSEKIYDLSNGNLIASILLSSKANIGLNVYQYAIKALSNVLETQDPETVFHLINEMRLQSGFSQLADISLVSDALNDLKAYYLQTIKDLFKRLSFDDINSIMSELVLKETTVNTNCSDFISSIVDYYEVLAQQHIESAEKDIKDLITLFNDLFKHKYILLQEEFNIDNFKEKSRFFNNISLSTIKTSDNAISWGSKEISNKLSSWIDIELPILIVNKSNGLFYKACDDLVFYCLNYLTEVLYTYQTKIALINIKTIFVHMVEVFGKHLYIDSIRVNNVQEGIKTIDNMLLYVDDYDYSLANFSIHKTQDLDFEDVLTINFDYLDYKTARYRWNRIFELNQPTYVNLDIPYMLINKVTRVNIIPFIDSELTQICIPMIISNAAMTLAESIMYEKKFYMYTTNTNRIGFCDSGLIVEGEIYKWSDIHIKVDDGTLSLKTDSACYTIDANSFDEFWEYILYRTFEVLQGKGSLNNQISLSEKLFMFAQINEWKIAQVMVEKHNDGVYSFPIKLKTL